MEPKCYFCNNLLQHQQTDMAADSEAMIRKYICPCCGRDYEICDPPKEERLTTYREHWSQF